MKFPVAIVAFLMTAVPGWAAPVSIVAIGASTTAGNKVGSSGAYPAQLESMLRAKGYDVSIQNGGVSGATSLDMVGRADSVPAGTRLVLLQIARSNDSRRGIAPKQTDANRSAIVSKLRARNIRVIMVDRRVSGDELAMDGLHPSADGQRTIAIRLLPQVMAAIGGRR